MIGQNKKPLIFQNITPQRLKIQKQMLEADKSLTQPIHLSKIADSINLSFKGKPMRPIITNLNVTAPLQGAFSHKKIKNEDVKSPTKVQEDIKVPYNTSAKIGKRKLNLYCSDKNNKKYKIQLADTKGIPLKVKFDAEKAIFTATPKAILNENYRQEMRKKASIFKKSHALNKALKY